MEEMEEEEEEEDKCRQVVDWTVSRTEYGPPLSHVIKWF